MKKALQAKDIDRIANTIIEIFDNHNVEYAIRLSDDVIEVISDHFDVVIYEYGINIEGTEIDDRLEIYDFGSIDHMLYYCTKLIVDYIKIK